MKALLKILIHAAIGGAAVGVGMIPAGAPITTRTYLWPILGSALSSVLSLLSSNPLNKT